MIPLVSNLSKNLAAKACLSLTCFSFSFSECSAADKDPQLESAAPPSWVSRDGRSISAKFIKLDGENLHIDKNGKKYVVPLGTLDAASVALARSLSHKVESVIFPTPLSVDFRFKCDVVNPLPNGLILMTGSLSKDANSLRSEVSFLWSPASRAWKQLRVEGMWGDANVSPVNVNNICISGRDGFVSKDGGETWLKAFEQFLNFEGKGYQINKAFWSGTNQDLLLLSGSSTESSIAKIFALNTQTGKIAAYSSLDDFIASYKFKDSKHYAWLGAPDAKEPKVVVSSDDGKSWSLVPSQESPFSLHIMAQQQIERLIDPKKLPKDPVRLAVTWAEDISGVAFCRIESLIGEPIDSSVSTMFISSDNGKSWAPINLLKSSSNLESLFVQSPFLTDDVRGGKFVNPNSSFHFRYDPSCERIYAGLESQWHLYDLRGRKWYPLVDSN